MASPNNMPHCIKIAYDIKVGRRRKQRQIKTFVNPYDARRFWTKKDKQGMNPKVINPSKELTDENISSEVVRDTQREVG